MIVGNLATTISSYRRLENEGNIRRTVKKKTEL